VWGLFWWFSHKVGIKIGGKRIREKEREGDLSFRHREKRSLDALKKEIGQG